MRGTKRKGSFSTTLVLCARQVQQIYSVLARTHTYTNTHTHMICTHHKNNNNNNIALQLLVAEPRLLSCATKFLKRGTLVGLTTSGVGTRNPTWTNAVAWEKALNLHPSKCQVPYPITAGWTGGRQRKKNKMESCQMGLELRTSGPEPRVQPLPPHSQTHTSTYVCNQSHTHTHTISTHTHIHTLSPILSSLASCWMALTSSSVRLETMLRSSFLLM